MKSNKPINILIQDYLDNSDVQEHIKNYNKKNIERFFRYLMANKIDVRNPRKADVLAYKAHLIKNNKSPNTIKTYLAQVRMFFKYLEDFGIYKNIASGIKAPPADNDRIIRDYLREEEIKALFKAIPRENIIGFRDYAIINLMLFTGIRRIETIRLKIKDIEQSAEYGHILKIQRKGQIYKQPIKLEPEISSPIFEYLGQRKNTTPESPLFANHHYKKERGLEPGSLSRIVKFYLKKATDKKNACCHSLRHTIAIHLIKSGSEIYDVQQFLGHNSTNTTLRYLKAIQAEKRINNPAARTLINKFINT